MIDSRVFDVIFLKSMLRWSSKIVAKGGGSGMYFGRVVRTRFLVMTLDLSEI